MNTPETFSAAVVALQKSLKETLEERDKARALLLSLIGSLTLADHMGDAAEDIYHVLKKLKMNPPDDAGELSRLGQWMGKEHGVLTLYGSTLYDPRTDDDDGDPD